MSISVKKDLILGKKITLLQPSKGYRAAIDPFFLAAFVPIKPNQQILDVGTGVGTVSLILSHNYKEINITAIDINQAYIDLAEQNLKINQCNNIKFICSNINNENKLLNNYFDHVISNPPFFELSKHKLSPSKSFANIETISLNNWLTYCVKKIHPKGMLTIIYEISRLPEILNFLTGKMGDINVFPLWPNQHTPAKRIIVQAKKNNNAPFKLNPGITLHKEDNTFTSYANKILTGEITNIL